MSEPKHLPPNTTPYHAVKATYEFAQFAESMRELARRTVAERDERERLRREHTTYAAAEQYRQSEGS